MTADQDSEGRAGRILVVDDTPANLRLLAGMLGAHGYTVHPATGGIPAVRFLQTTLPDLILLDIIMPDMDGYQLCRRFKADERTRDIPVIFISSADEELNKMMKAFASGGVDYIVRPLQLEEVLARLRTHLSRYRLQKHLEDEVQQRTAALRESNAHLRQENIERQLAEQRIRYMAHYDALTSLPNWALLQDRVHQAIARAHRERTQAALLFLDLDDFKHINDSLGHQVGDCLLQSAAVRLLRCVREGDSVARLGGDEFVLCLSSLAYLQRFPVHALKIDRSFIHGIGRNANDTALVTAIIAMARVLHLEVLAEGVESADQIEFLLAHGCLLAQGYFYSQAVSAQAFTDLLRQPDRKVQNA